MKRVLCIGLSATAMFLANTSHADFTFQSSSSNACETVPGRWAGTGKGSNWLFGECSYRGTGDISALDQTGHFTLTVNVDKDSGNFLCPAHEERVLTGVCTNGIVTITTEFGNISGNFSEKSGNASGTLSGLGMDFKVSAQFHRTN